MSNEGAVACGIDCPNLLWELMPTRREKLTAQQLLSKNISERIVDKDNHTRDAVKYVLMSLPEPRPRPQVRRNRKLASD